ncbi:MAG: hypothetical protein AAGF26_14445 [Cyanobacteria bacterium P01_G01_bin.49]
MIDELNRINNNVLVCGTILTSVLLISAATIVLNSGSFSYQRGDTAIHVQAAEKAINNEKFSNKRLAEELAYFKLILEQNNTPPEVKEAFEKELEPTASTAIDNADELREVAEKVILPAE